jgi:hypothetical protein
MRGLDVEDIIKYALQFAIQIFTSVSKQPQAFISFTPTCYKYKYFVLFIRNLEVAACQDPG